MGLSGDGVSVDLGQCPVVESLLEWLPFAEHFGVVERNGAHLRAGEAFEVAVDVTELAFQRTPAGLDSRVDAATGTSSLS
jgi:hypothetical protein